MSEILLSEIAHIYSGMDYKRNPPGGNIPIYGTGGLMGYTSIALYNGPSVLSGRKGSINNPIYVEGEFWNVDTIFCIITNDGVDTKWLYYNFLNTDLTRLIEATGVPSVNSRSLYRLKFKWFELPEQQQIAKILSTADAVIEKTQAAIAKYKAIKQGMLQDLFTRGIDITTNKLRPRYEDAPHLYKKSKLGMIPVEWVYKVFGKEVDLIHGHQ
ncbi:MAG: restriction endonuclease subunit S, partial [Paludibacter sp.]|nr:restriction endonuclease subunit S [Paludibacter sp.]